MPPRCARSEGRIPPGAPGGHGAGATLPPRRACSVPLPHPRPVPTLPSTGTSPLVTLSRPRSLVLNGRMATQNAPPERRQGTVNEAETPPPALPLPGGAAPEGFSEVAALASGLRGVRGGSRLGRWLGSEEAVAVATVGMPWEAAGTGSWEPALGAARFLSPRKRQPGFPSVSC